MLLKFLKIRIFIWIILFSIFSWWVSKSVNRYWNQPLTTEIVYSFGDNENGIQFPLMTFCDGDYTLTNKILQECSSKLFFIDMVTDCLKHNKNYKLSTFMNSLQTERRQIINITRFWNGFKNTEIDHFESNTWLKVFHPMYGPCFTFDISNIEKLKYISYQGYARPEFDFILSENIPWENLRILLHTKYDLPDAYQLNGRIQIRISKNSTKAHMIGVRKKISDRESTRKIPCTQYEYMTCQNIEDNNLVLNQYNCRIPILNYGQHLDNIIPKETSFCSDEVVKNALNLIANKKKQL